MTNKPVIDWPHVDLEVVDICPVCGGLERSVLHKNISDYVFGTAGRWTLVRCEHCRSAYLDPRPTQGSIARAYQSYYTHIPDLASTTILKRLSRSARNGYINRLWKTQLAPSSKILGSLVAASTTLKAKIDHELMRGFKRSDNSHRLLDVGCGSGQFLELMQCAGWTVKGVDFDIKAVSAARQRGLDVEVGGLEVLNGGDGLYDAVTLSHVIEHVFEPIETLKRCFDLVRPGGILWIETPNIDSEGHTLFGRHWRGLEPPRHLVLFNWKSMHSLLENVGFKSIEPAPWRPMYGPLVHASFRISQNETTNNPMNLRPVSALAVLRQENRARASFHAREYITYIARKP